LTSLQLEPLLQLHAIRLNNNDGRFVVCPWFTLRSQKKPTTNLDAFLSVSEDSRATNTGVNFGVGIFAPNGFFRSRHQELVAPKRSKHGQEETMNSEARKAKQLVVVVCGV